MKRTLTMLAVLVVALAVASAVHVDGELRPVSPSLSVAIRGSEGWYAHPTLASRADDGRGVYVVAPVLPEGRSFPAIRVDTVNGTQSAASVVLDPSSPFRAFTPAAARAEVRGLRFQRPALHLMTLPDGKGPGVHRVDSATGRLAVRTDERILVTRNVFNSRSTPEVLSLVLTDPNGRWLSVLTRTDSSWELFLFSPDRVEES